MRAVAASRWTSQRSASRGNGPEYVAGHVRPGVDAGDLVLNVASGSGLAIEPARLRSVPCCGVDASARLVAVARDRSPG
jgi:hypothetical protein